MLACLVTGTAYSEQLPSKPFKVCPEVVTAKDTPCHVLGPTAAVVHRTEIPKDDKDRERIKMIIETLRELANALEKDLEKSNK